MFFLQSFGHLAINVFALFTVYFLVLRVGWVCVALIGRFWS